MASLAVQENIDEETASTPVTPVMLNITGRKKLAAAESDTRSRMVISNPKLSLEAGLIWILLDAL